MATTLFNASWARNLPQNRAAITQSIPIIRKIIASDQFRSSGFTTAEIFRLAVKEPVPNHFEKYELPSETEIHHTKSGQRKSPPPPPPHPEHPVRSIQFLKKQVLPILRGSNEIRMATGKRFITVAEGTVGPNALAKTKGKGKASSASSPIPSSASPTSTSHTVRLWMPGQKHGVKKISSTPTPFGVQVGVGEDWDHLNKRRRNTRDEKVQHDVNIMAQVQKAENQQRKRLAWQERVQRLERKKERNAERYQRWQQRKAEVTGTSVI